MNNDFELAKEILAKNGKITGLASGRSMWPLLRSQKDTATIVPLTKTPAINDVILYRKATTNELILHRIIKIRNNGFIIRGDNVYYTERDVKTNDIVGLMTGFTRNGKYRECENSCSYKLYVFYIRASYPLRRLIRKALSFCKIILYKKQKHS